MSRRRWCEVGEPDSGDLVQVQIVMYWENLGKSFHLLSPLSSSVTGTHGVLVTIK